MKTKRISLADIAESLNVSKSTVSFVLNGKGKQFNISQNTQELVHAKAKELNYVPNFFAKGLRQGKTHTIGLVLADISNPFYSELSKTIQQALYADGYSVFIVSTNDDSKLEVKLIRDLLMRSVDALIIAPCCDAGELKEVLEEVSVPVLFVDRMLDESADFVGVDWLKESEKLVRSFSSKPRKIGIIHLDGSRTMTTTMRITGMTRACANQGISCEVLALSENPLTAGEQISELIQLGVDSIVPLTDKAALSTLALLKRLSIPVPGHVRMIAFNDSESFQWFSPAISALHQPVEQIGTEAVKRLLDCLLLNVHDTKHLVLDSAFIARNTH